MRKGLFLAGLLVLGTGFYIVVLAIGILPHEGLATPHWILGLAGMAFVVGGGLVSLGELLRHDDAIALRDLEVARTFRNFLVAILLLIFVVVGNWVAFGPGSRPVQSVLGLPFSDVPAQTSEWVGRFGFGVSAIALDSIILLIFLAVMRRSRKRQSGME